MKNKEGALIVLTGPSGAGKTTLCEALFKAFSNLRFSVSCTTRPARDDEIDGIHYQFWSKEQFQEGIAHDDFVEYAEVHGNFYGTLKTELQIGIDMGWLTLLDIDVQGQTNNKNHAQLQRPREALDCARHRGHKQPTRAPTKRCFGDEAHSVF